MVKASCYYHSWADGAWYAPVTEHFAALKEYAFTGEVRVTLVGTEENREHAREVIRDMRPGVSFREYGSGFEELTLNQMRADAADAGPDTVFLYMHSKGSFHPGVNQNLWRRGMTKALLEDWFGLAVDVLNNGYDASGPHWVTPGDFPGCVHVPMFGGNFFLATAAFLATLPVLPELSVYIRHWGEGWIGKGNPRVLPLSRTWPNYVSGEAE